MYRWDETIEAEGKKIEIKFDISIEDALPDLIEYFEEKGVDLTSTITPEDKKLYFEVSKYLYLMTFNFCKKEKWSLFITIVISLLYLESKIDKWVQQDRDGSAINFALIEYDSEDITNAKEMLAQYMNISTPKVIIESFNHLASYYHKYLSEMLKTTFKHDQTKLLESIMYTYFLFKHLVKKAKIVNLGDKMR